MRAFGFLKEKKMEWIRATGTRDWGGRERERASEGGEGAEESSDGGTGWD